jgi:outer membrane protein OmpA-like peptidoglycan-associated protein
LEFDVGSAKPAPAELRKVRDLVDKHGYKDKKYLITGYAGELARGKYNRNLGRKRCQQVLGLFRKRGVSRRWLVCQDPVFREKDGAPSAAHKGPAWRRVEVRVTK